MPTAAPKKAAPKAAPKANASYINKSTVNLFTSAGRCGPNQTVTLSEEEAKLYKGLELCQ